MEMTVREVRSQFAAAIAHAERGERVSITKDGKIVAELGPPSAPASTKKWDWDELDRLQEELGIPTPSDEQAARIEQWLGDHAHNREMLGLDEDWGPYRP